MGNGKKGDKMKSGQFFSGDKTKNSPTHTGANGTGGEEKKKKKKPGATRIVNKNYLTKKKHKKGKIFLKQEVKTT